MAEYPRNPLHKCAERPLPYSPQVQEHRTNESENKILRLAVDLLSLDSLGLKYMGAKHNVPTEPSDWEETFFAVLAESGNVSKACRQAGIDNSLPHHKRRRDPRFAAQWQEVEDVVAASLETEAIRRARDGVDEPVWYKGAEVGTVRKYSDSLLLALLRRFKPDEYNLPTKVGGDGPNGAIETVVRVVYEDSIPKVDEPETDISSMYPGLDGDESER